MRAKISSYIQLSLSINQPIPVHLLRATIPGHLIQYIDSPRRWLFTVFLHINVKPYILQQRSESPPTVPEEPPKTMLPPGEPADATPEWTANVEDTTSSEPPPEPAENVTIKEEAARSPLKRWELLSSKTGYFCRKAALTGGLAVCGGLTSNNRLDSGAQALYITRIFLRLSKKDNETVSLRKQIIFVVLLCHTDFKIAFKNTTFSKFKSLTPTCLAT